MEVNHRHVTVVLNPAAGRGEGSRRRPELRSMLEDCAKKYGIHQLDIVETTARGDGVPLARAAVEQGADLIVAAGGDGTLGEVVNGMIGSGAMLGIIPVGTGNDFGRDWDRRSNAFAPALQLARAGLGRDGSGARLQVRRLRRTAGRHRSIAIRRASPRCAARSRWGRRFACAT